MQIIDAIEDKANPLILDRPESIRHLKDFEEVLIAIDDLVDYGTNLILRCFVTSDRSIKDTVVLLTLLKQVVGFLDSCAIQLRNGAVDPAMLQLRAIFEASVYIEWILKTDSDKRARAYYVADKRKDLKWQYRFIPGTKEYKAFHKDIRPYRSNLPIRSLKRHAISEANRINAYLNKRQFRQMNSIFESRMKSGKYEINWYQAVFRPKYYKRQNLRTLSNSIKKMSQYRMLYEPGSEMMHSSSIKSHLKFSKSSIHLKGLRNLENLPNISNFIISIMLSIYRCVLTNYRNDELGQFKRDYQKRWQKSLLIKKNVNYSYIFKEI